MDLMHTAEKNTKFLAQTSETTSISGYDNYHRSTYFLFMP